MVLVIVLTAGVREKKPLRVTLHCGMKRRCDKK